MVLQDQTKRSMPKKVGRSGIGNRIDGELRTDDFTIMAIDTSIRVQDLGRVVSLFVELLGENQDIAGTKFDTITASLASLNEDVNDAPGDIDHFRIQRFTPKFHRVYPLCRGVRLAKRSLTLCQAFHQAEFYSVSILRGDTPFFLSGVSRSEETREDGRETKDDIGRPSSERSGPPSYYLGISGRSLNARCHRPTRRAINMVMGG
jgi:hypothetical protein